MFLLAMQLNVVVKAAIEKGGPIAAGVPVTVQDVDIQLLRGKFMLENLKIGNPKGFTEENIVSVGKVRVAIQWMSLIKDTIVIKQVVVLEPEIAYERRRKTTNIDALLNGMTGGSSSPAPAASSPRAKSSAPGKKVKIGFFKIAGAKVHLATHLLGKTRKINLKLPDIKLKNVGNDGASFKDIARQVFKAINRSTYRAVTKHAAVRKAGKLAEKARSTIEKTTKGVLKGLFNR